MSIISEETIAARAVDAAARIVFDNMYRDKVRMDKQIAEAIAAFESKYPAVYVKDLDVAHRLYESGECATTEIKTTIELRNAIL